MSLIEDVGRSIVPWETKKQQAERATKTVLVQMLSESEKSSSDFNKLFVRAFAEKHEIEIDD